LYGSIPKKLGPDSATQTNIRHRGSKLAMQIIRAGVARRECAGISGRQVRACAAQPDPIWIDGNLAK
jgi:hypothetical protein